MESIKFIEEQHKYFVGGERYYCTSDILKDAGISDYSYLESTEKGRKILENACRRGDAAHYATRLDDLEIINESTVHTEVMPYLLGWRKFKAEHECAWIDIEEPLYSKKYHFATTPDRVGFVDGVVCDAEIKCTAQVMPSFGPQTASHVIAWSEHKRIRKIEKRLVVMLKPDGTYRMLWQENKTDKTVFLNALNLFYWKLKNKLI